MLTSLPVVLTLLASAFAAPQVKIGKTTIIGRDVTLLHQDFFGGIPYAEAPIGKLRLKPPVIKTNISYTTFDASNYGPGCLQPGDASLYSEDCLSINIFRPSGISANASLPVMFWTYGGSFTSGSSFLYNASAIVYQSMARGTPIIYVSFNYRLGPLGFPQGQESENRGALNLAIKDQLAALAWVQANIGAFGGDKTKVTIFGQSAGSIMSSILFLNSPVEKLARAAIFESGSQATSLNFNAARRENSWQNFVGGVPSCSYAAKSGHTYDCLSKASSADIYTGLLVSLSKATELFPFSPTIDGPAGVYPDLPSRLFASNKFAKLPFIAGTVLDEGTLFTPKNINSESALNQLIIANFSPPVVQISSNQLQDSANKLLQLYPDVPSLGSPFNTGDETFGLSSIYKQTAALEGDMSFESQRRYWIQTASNAGVKTYGYLFTQPQPNAPPANGVPHSSEVLFVYGAPSDTSASAVKLSSMMINYWVSFATSLDPNDGLGTARPQWAQYTPSNQALIQLNGNNITMIPDDYRKKQIDFINSVPAVFHHRREWN